MSRPTHLSFCGLKEWGGAWLAHALARARHWDKILSALYPSPGGGEFFFRRDG